ncbi:1,4-dihydroxy-2-naphthoate octaprenyltransferase [Muribaculum intestinale]|uniref:1,4-dihydroxy-2-naphthoate octaprenyltransferase n=2 Tax=Muribaculum intestinale TaxID=1796646 RepID=A0A4S2FNK5_9BACT|nr:1,4-dihydroxy-2-naphthoate octaprenyltransferase [Muribaculum intestinale]MYM13294.1 1,4-dihydroxy-2-naphthoate octaprenyltransferase [Muribaculum intestinale]TGY70674.1 1,4-dihydroxy-2-naphthoate octaprenyltransferase [Muribaculum intestinale]
MTLKPWIEAMRLRTLPVSAAGVLTAIGYNVGDGTFKAAPAALCLIFALLAQVASNFANEYYDYRDGLDRAGRDGPRRGVTEGDITPGAMLRATYATLGMACCVGLSLLWWGGWWLLIAGIVIAIGAMAYSAGPYPLSRHGLGEVAVIIFFGVIPVNLTYYVQSGYFAWPVGIASAAIGLMGANVLLVNNYRDADDDAAVGKRTLAVIMGRGFAYSLYLINGVLGMLLLLDAMGVHRWIAWVYLAVHLLLCMMLKRRTGRAINPLLGMTAVAMLAVALAWLVSEICSKGV